MWHVQVPPGSLVGHQRNENSDVVRGAGDLGREDID
jgi:hypothetical protein